MENRKLATILRCTGLALFVLGAFVLLPAAAQAQCTPGNHGVSIFKSCTSPKNRCGTDADCSDADLCNGIEQCATEEAPGSNVVQCIITLANPTTHCDNLTLLDASDAVLNATGPGASSTTLLITGTPTGVVSGTCTAGTDLGGAVTCTIAPGGSVDFLANYYTLVPTDPSVLTDQATVSVQDTCSAGAGGCSTTPNAATFSASTDTVSGCSPGAPLNCDDLNACTTDSCVPATGCLFTPVVCNDGLLCTTDSCVPATGCTTTPVVCNDSNACTNDSCDPATGSTTVCATTPVVCTDDLFCSTVICDTVNGCIPGVQDEFCNDQNACTTDTCDETLNACSNVDNVTPTCDANCEECDTTTGACVPLDPLPAICVPAPGRMTGGGSIFTKAGGRVTHGFELHCDVEIGPNNLEINWGKGNHCHLTELVTAVCTNDPDIVPRPPSADFDTFEGTGTMTCNGEENCTIDFTLTDAGEPGKVDTARYNISCPSGLTLTVEGNLNKGNQQAHKN